MNNMNNDNGKILLATLAGIGAGIAAGVLLSPKKGEDNRNELKRALTKAGDDLNTTIKSWTENLKTKSGAPNRADDQIVMHGSWDDVKRQLRKNYAELTDEDLTYQQGRENELLNRLQARLNKTKDEVTKLLSELRG